MPAITSLTAESIFFAVNAAIKLSHNVRKAYAQSLRSKALILPLPGIDPNIKIHTIIRFFNDHPDFVSTVSRLEVLHEEASTTLKLENEEDLKEYMEYYLVFNGVEEGDGFKIEVNTEDLIHLLRIRQWERGREEHQTVLQLVSGTIVELGIDYFLQVPGALNRKSAQGQILYKFLEGLDDIKFEDNKEIKKDLSQQLLPSLFTAAAESVAALSPKIANDEKIQAFIKVAANGIANDVFERAKAMNMNAHQREDAVHWGQVMMRSMINHAGHFVFSAPEELFDTNRPVSQIIEKSGVILLNTILADQSDKVSFRKALSPETLDKMARATLQVVAEHPNVLSGEHGIQKIVSEVAVAVQQEDFLRQGFLPELTRIVLEKSAGHLDLLWKKSTDGPEHLLVIAIQQSLKILADKPLDAPWRPAFTKGNLLEVLEEVLDEVVSNPAWITDEVKGRPILAEVIDATFSALDSIPKGERLTAEVIQWLLRHNLEVALTSRAVLDTVKWGGDQLEISILQKALELSLSVVFPKEGGPNVNRLNLLADLMDYVMEAILKQHPNENGLILADLILFNSGIDYSQGFNPQLADQITDAALQAIANQPGLVAKPEVLRNILAGVAGALTSAKLKQPALLPRLVQLVLENTALNAQLLLDADPAKPRHLLVTALTQILQALAATDDSGQWRPGISPAQAEHLIESLLDEVVQRPQWVTDKVNQDSLLSEVLDVTFLALAGIPSQQRLAPDTIEQLLQLNLRTVASSPQVLKNIKWGGEQKEKGILLRGLELVFAFTFPSGAVAGRSFLLMDLTDYILEVLLSNHPDKKGLILANLILSEENGIDYSRGFNPALADQLVDSALLVLSENPELVAQEEALQLIIKDVASALSASGLERPELLPELIRLTLESSATHLYRLFNIEEAGSKHLLAIALQQILKAIAQKPNDGKWKPRLSNEQIMETVELLFDAILDNPRWVETEDQIFTLLEAIFRALESIPPAERLPYLVLKGLIDSALEAANKQRKLVTTIETADGPVQLRLQFSLESLFVSLYDEDRDEEVAWHLSQGHIVNLIVGYYLMYLAGSPANKKDVERARARINKALNLWKKDFSQLLEDVFEELDEQENA